MNENLLLILNEESYNMIFGEENNLYDYYNYLASVYRQIESYKGNHMNFIEYVISKEEVLEFLTKNSLTVNDLRNDIHLLTFIEIPDYFNNQSFPKVPDYLLKTTNNFVLPIQFITEDVNKNLLFKDIQLSDNAIQKIKEVIDKCFSIASIERYRDMIAKGQNITISSDLLSVNTYVNNDYDLKFENKVLDNIDFTFKTSDYDELLIHEQDNKIFVVKLLNIYFEGSFYEYRNFIYNNQAFIRKISKIIQDEINQKTNHAYEVRPVLDRFILSKTLDEAYSKILNSFPYLALYKDIDSTDFYIPSDINSIDVRKLEMKYNCILMSNFTKENAKKLIKGYSDEKSEKTNNRKSKKSKNTSSKKEKPEIDLEELRKIHMKKFPDIPFPYDKKLF